MLKLAHSITRDLHTVTPREMELWVEHMGNGATEENLLAWCEAAKAEGLHPDGYAEDMARLVNFGFSRKPEAH